MGQVETEITETKQIIDQQGQKIKKEIQDATKKFVNEYVVSPEFEFELLNM